MSVCVLVRLTLWELSVAYVPTCSSSVGACPCVVAYVPTCQLLAERLVCGNCPRLCVMCRYLLVDFVCGNSCLSLCITIVAYVQLLAEMLVDFVCGNSRACPCVCHMSVTC